MNRYVIGFIFDQSMNNVCLIRKNRPVWQKGYLNGVGGRIEQGEHAFKAISRESCEEAGVLVSMDEWTHVLTLRFPYAEIEIFACRDDAYYEKARTCTDEEVVKVAVSEIESCSMVYNAPCLVELSILRLDDREF